MNRIRIGYGFDVHPFSEGRKLMLGGVRIPHHAGLLGHSDADALLHALTDAILGALALGDIGTHFPDTDPQYRGADSGVLLQEAYAMVRARGYRLGNADMTVVCEHPKLKPHINPIRKRIAALLDAGEEDLSVKATTNEKMGFVGRQEGIAVHAVVLLVADEHPDERVETEG